MASMVTTVGRTGVVCAAAGIAISEGDREYRASLTTLVILPHLRHCVTMHRP